MKIPVLYDIEQLIHNVYKSYKLAKQNNKIVIVDNGVEYNKANFFNIRGLNIIINGKNNTIRLHKDSKFFNCNLIIDADSTQVEICKGVFLKNSYIHLHLCNKGKLCIGDRTEINSIKIFMMEENNSINIGKDCLFANDIEIWSSDCHPIYDVKSGKRINTAQEVSIGDSVWCAQAVRILKNVRIPSNSILAQGSIITKSFEECGCILAGNPARIVKRNIKWNKILSGKMK